MSKKAFKSAIRSLGRAFRAKDEAGFDEALGEMEEAVEDMAGKDEEEPDTIEVHNHIPDHRDTAIGELPGKEDTVTTNAFDGEEAPPWFKKHEEATDKKFKAMSDSIAKMNDRRDEFEPGDPDEREDEGMIDDDPNLEMDRRRSSDEPSEREEMAERMKENGADRRRAANSDEANKAILGELEYEAPPGTGDKARKARDSRYLEESFQDVVSKAEVLAPGVNLPTFDGKASPVKTFRAIDRLRRTTLDLAYHKSETRGIIDAAMSGRTFDAKKCRTSDARTIFNVLANEVAKGNNARATDTRQAFNGNNNGATHAVAGSIQSLADINKRNAEVYKR